MTYYVIGQDGNQYGPADFNQLQEWVREQRVYPTTQLRDASTGQAMSASSLPGLFQPTPPVVGPDWSQPPSHYARPAVPFKADDGKSELIGALVRCGAALLFFFVLHGLGFIFAIYAVIYSFQAKAKGHKFGLHAVVISLVTLALVGIGWFFRLQGR